MRQKFKASLSLFYNLFILLWGKRILSARRHKVVYLDCRDYRMQYYYFFILFAFLEEGFFVRIRARAKLIAGFSIWVRDILKNKNVGIYFYDKKGDNRLCLSDYDRKQKINKSIILTSEWHSISKSDKNIHEILPYQMHPYVYLKGHHKKVEALRNTKKTFTIFYSGNTSEDAYDSNEIHEKFGLINRFRIIEYLSNNLSENELLQVQGKNEVNKLRDINYLNKLIMIKWGWTQSSSFNFDARINLNEWLPTLAKAHFFLACPGIKIPFSHNIIEAMSVGVIPILSYRSLFRPNLENGINCFDYKNESELVQLIKRILRMDRGQFDYLKNNVINYYEKYLANKNNINVIERALVSDKSVAFINEIVY